MSKKSIIDIIKKIEKEIKDCFHYAKNSEFPDINSFEDLNLSKKTPLADKLLKEFDEPNFDEDQKIVQVKGY